MRKDTLNKIQHLSLDHITILQLLKLLLGDYAKIWHYGMCWWMQGYSNQLCTGICNGEIPLNFNKGCVPDSLGFWKTQAFSKADGNLKAPLYETTSYLLCYHEVVAEWLTGTNGSQQKSKHHVQKPPANNKNKPISSQQDKTIEDSATGRARRQMPTSWVFSLSARSVNDFASGINLTPIHFTYPLCCQGQLQHDCRYPWREGTHTPQGCRGEISQSWGQTF